MNACGRYLGRVRSATLVRTWRPNSATSEPSRASTWVDCGCGTMRHGSASWAARGAAPGAARAREMAAAAREKERRRDAGRWISWPNTGTNLRGNARGGWPRRERTPNIHRPGAADLCASARRSAHASDDRAAPAGTSPVAPPRPSRATSSMPAPLHLALAQFKPRKGDYAANVARLRDLFAQAVALRPRPAVLHLPETALTGYFVEGGVRDLAVTAGTLARDLDDAYRGAAGDAGPLDLVVGFYELYESTLYNSAMYVTVGGGEGASVRHVHRKNFLPTYGLFDEERFVERGHEIRAFDAGWGRAAILVCEDAWHSITGTVAALDGAEVIFVCAAAPARGVWPRDDGVPGPASVARWERLVRDIAEEHGVFVTLANLVGSEGGKTFGGSSSVTGPKGDLRVRGPMFEEALVSITLDLGDLARARADMPLLSDFRTALPHLRRTLDDIMTGTPAAHVFDPADGDGLVHGLVRADVDRARGNGALSGDGDAPAPSSAPSAGAARRDRPATDGAPGRAEGAGAGPPPQQHATAV